uniref:Uncharacterized protein n=1 Tax=Alexandrium andersonii TaxID=327968 RepID=A0A7S2F1K2_9DINO
MRVVAMEARQHAEALSVLEVFTTDSARFCRPLVNQGGSDLGHHVRAGPWHSKVPVAAAGPAAQHPALGLSKAAVLQARPCVLPYGFAQGVELPTEHAAEYAQQNCEVHRA